MMEKLGGVRDEAATRSYLQTNLDHWEIHGFGLWIVRTKAAGALAGRCCLRHILLTGEDEVELGYGFLPAFWRKGLATEIGACLLGVGFRELQLDDIVAITLPENIGSQRVMQKLGMRYDGRGIHAGLPHVKYRISITEWRQMKAKENLQ